MCCGCHHPIADRYIMRVMDHSWHETCLQCAVCQILLTQTCYIRDRKLYCKSDYDKLYAAKCTGCLEPIAPTELVMRALDHVYHINCFLCVGCGRQLQKGDQFVIRAGRLFCRPDFEKEMALIHMANSGGRQEASPIPGGGTPNGGQQQSLPSMNGTPPHRQDGRRGPKRPRTILTTAQRRAFKASFEISQKPCRKVRETLAKETGLSVRIVQVWFQNQRAKLKKIQRKQQQIQATQGGGGGGVGVIGGGSESGGGLHSQSSISGDKSKGDNTSYSLDMLDNDTSNLTADDDDDDDDDDCSSVGDSPQFSLPPLHYMSHSPDESYYSPQDDGYTKSELAMDSETSLGGLEDVLINQSGGGVGGGNTVISIGGGVGGLSIIGDNNNNNNNPVVSSTAAAIHHTDISGHTASTLFGGPTSMTPIDKLYSMQSSYFNSGECECLGAPN
ncbi:LIM homeobox transcription factor 1-beta-like isoform X2 [Oppia nitens]|uniref:LIM homeobox transcription factor 1-beta-like isoform X2 n=1 Tax=Oppia nitens TaxID=1686743 RepID=UPI0023DA2386|nr:LIM homeobox transcription factor 1-beta-like isoform X2 [Oppia nitens]